MANLQNKKIGSLCCLLRHLVSLCIAIAISTAVVAGDNLPEPSDFDPEQLRLHQLQFLGSHNSYHLRANEPVLNFLKGLSFIFPKEYNPKDLDYEHEPLRAQLDSFHLRSFEIDIYADPEGGHYYKRKKNNLLGKPKASGNPLLLEPGFKVFHIPDIDYNSRYTTFKEMLSDFKSWSDEHPSHFPIFILVESKTQTIAEKIKKLKFTHSIPYCDKMCDALDEEVKAVFGDSLHQVITPDKVRGNFATLNEAVLAKQWPTLAESRGKFIFILMSSAVDAYTANHPSLAGRVMFTFSEPGKPESAFLKFDDAHIDEQTIRKAVEQGYLVRTRADGPNIQNRSGDYTQQQSAFRSGAQIISTDYYRPDPRHEYQPKKFTRYHCTFGKGKIIRVNPVLVSPLPDLMIKE